MKSTKTEILEIAKIVAIGCVGIAPIWILANELLADEFVKSGAGVAALTFVALAIRMLKGSE